VSPSVAARVTEPAAREAARWLQEAERHFQNGTPSAAIPLLERAYRLTGWGGCLLNLGMAHHARGDCPTARDYYAQYLDTDPYTERRDQVEAALEELRQACDQTRGAPLMAAAEAPPDAIAALALPRAAPTPDVDARSAAAAPFSSPAARTRFDSTRRLWAISGLGLGGATAAAAVVLLVSGEHYNREAQRLGIQGRNPDNDRIARDVDRQGRRSNTLALVFGAGSLLLVGTSASLLWLVESEHGASVSLAVNQGSPRFEFRTPF
jgi:hypothetical protein